MTKNRKDVYQTVTNKIILQLEKSIKKGWSKPWVDRFGGRGPVSTIGRRYRGINVPLLYADDSASQVYGTFKAWKSVGCSVKKRPDDVPAGLWGTNVVAWVTVRPDDPTSRPFMFPKFHTVFPAEKVTGPVQDVIDSAREPVKLPDGVTPQKHVDALLADYMQKGPSLTTGHNNRAYYHRGNDQVTMPAAEQFKTTEGYYAVLLHEMAHSTGHKSRLDRQFGATFGDDAYAFEELIAELSAAMTCGACQISGEPRPDHAEYLRSWLKVLREDKKAIFKAASAAQKAADLILGTKYQAIENPAKAA